MNHITSSIDHAVSLLQQGGVVAIPTETVYGLAASADSPTGIAKVFAVKGRPTDHPLILHIGDKQQLSHYASAIPAYVQRLIDHFWPGPLTLVLEKKDSVSDAITAGQATVAIRQPAHPLALTLIKQLNQAIVAPSANRFGQVSPTTAQHVQEDLGDDVDAIVDGGRCELGIESTIINAMHADHVTILREGAISTDAIAGVLGDVPLRSKVAVQQPRVSGDLASHYAPVKPLRLYQQGAQLPDDVDNYYILYRQQPVTASYSYAMPDDAASYAYQLYYQLRIADAAAIKGIFVELPPDTPTWAAVRDRLQRAAV